MSTFQERPGLFTLKWTRLWSCRSNYVEGIKMLGAYFHEVSQLE